MAPNHHPNGGKLRHSASPATIVTLSWGSRSTTACLKRLNHRATAIDSADFAAGSSGVSSAGSAAGSSAGASESSSATAGKMSVSSDALDHSRLPLDLTMDDGTPVYGL